MKSYRLSKARQILERAITYYKKNDGSINENQRKQLHDDIIALDSAILNKDTNQVNILANKIDSLVSSKDKKSPLKYLIEIIIALVVAIILATIVRQTWFEFQEIPTGSMRPTYKEEDHLIVSKVPYGINLPFSTAHIYFDPNLVQRTNVFTFSADNIPMRDADTKYFGIFPYKKRLVKRLMGKPGDTVYFYGGRVYSLDKDGKPNKELLEAPWMQNLEFIPFMNFAGEPLQNGKNSILLRHMNLGIARLNLLPDGKSLGQVFDGKSWVTDDPIAALKPHSSPITLADFWGFGNFAMVQLLSKAEVLANGDADLSKLDDAELYLEIRHSPSVSIPQPIILRHPTYGPFVKIPAFRTYLPLKSEHLNALMDTLYTARFVVEGGNVKRYSGENYKANPIQFKFNNLEDGTYEFYNGKAYKIAYMGYSSEMPVESPLYDRSVEQIKNLFNLGIDFEQAMAPRGHEQLYYPHRYAYFRDGDLYLMGSPVIKKDDPTLQKFLEHELAHQKEATSYQPYIAFVDHGVPSEETIKLFGLKIPEESYLALGDNHAMSGDSRVWGFVPEENIQGAPSYLLWPAGERHGTPTQEPSHPWVTVPHIILWILLLLGLIGAAVYYYRRAHSSLLPKDF